MVDNRSNLGLLGGSAVADNRPETLDRPTWLMSNALQDALLASSKIAILAADTTGMIRFFNRGAERLLGYSAADIIGRRNVVDIHDPRELEARAHAVSRDLVAAVSPGLETLTCNASRSDEDGYETALIGGNRERLPVGVVITVLRDDSGSITGYLFIMTDLSVRRRARLEQGGTASVAETADFPPTALLADVSHEMRTPLTAILGFSQLMQAAAQTPTVSQRRSLDMILQAGWQLDNLLTMTRDLALIEAGKLPLSMHAVPLAAVMLDCQAMINSQENMRGVRVKFPPFDTPCFVSADRHRLQQVLSNLLAAAIEYSAVGGALVVDCETRGLEWMRIAVTDGRDRSFPEGPPRVFHQAAGRGQQPATAPGTGIGLLLARHLVGLMGGAIGPERTAGSRMLFSFDLKRIPAGADESTPSLATPFNASATSAANANTR